MNITIHKHFTKKTGGSQTHLDGWTYPTVENHSNNRRRPARAPRQNPSPLNWNKRSTFIDDGKIRKFRFGYPPKIGIFSHIRHIWNFGFTAKKDLYEKTQIFWYPPWIINLQVRCIQFSMGAKTRDPQEFLQLKFSFPSQRPRPNGPTKKTQNVHWCEISHKVAWGNVLPLLMWRQHHCKTEEFSHFGCGHSAVSWQFTKKRADGCKCILVEVRVPNNWFQMERHD